MTFLKLNRQGWLEIFIYLLLGCLVYFLLAWQVITEAATTQTAPNWSSPLDKAIKQISAITGTQTSPILLENTDCLMATFRTPTTSAMSTGCFGQTSMGLMDSDSNTVIFNGTDEALPIIPFSPHQVLAPRPGSYSLIALDTVSTGGAYISLYMNPLGYLKEVRDPYHQIISKMLTAPPEIQLRDRLGQKLVINSQTLAFSSGGDWLVAETLNGSFVRVDLETLEIKPFTNSFSTSGSPAVLKSRLSVSDDGRYVAIYSKDDSSFKVHDLSDCGPPTANLQPEKCPSYDYLPFIQSQIKGLQLIRHVRFVNDGLISFEARSSIPGIGGTYVIAPRDQITSLIDYLGLGDSYTSGEGAFDYLAGTDTADNMCHLSIRSYPLLLTNDLYSSQSGHSVACSGAVINDVMDMGAGYRGQVRDVLDFKQLTDKNQPLLDAVFTNFVPGYISQQRFVKKYQPAVITVSIGGNDVGFGDILEECVAPHFGIKTDGNDCFSTYEDRLELIQQIDRTYKSWVSTFKSIQASSPTSSVYAIGYPQIANSSGNCALNVRLSRSELELAGQMTDYINQSIEKAAIEAGVLYADISHALDGHRLCEANDANTAVNGLTAGKDVGLLGVGLLGKESYHPNALGHKLIEQAILDKTRNLVLKISSNIAQPNSSSILQAPKSGRKVITRIPGSKISSKVLQRGKPAIIKAEGPANGLKANSTYTVKIGGVSGQSTGSVSTDNAGNIYGTVQVSSDKDSGGTTIDIIGENQSGETVDITQPILIPAGETDADEDGVANTSDSCPYLPNAGVDSDSDGIDDSCDGTLASPTQPRATNAGSGTISSTDHPSIIVPGPHVTGSTLSLGAALSALTSRAVVQTTTAAKTMNKKPDVKPTLATIHQKSPPNLNTLARTDSLHIAKISHPHIIWKIWIPAAISFWLCIVIFGVHKNNQANQKMPAV